MSEGRATQPPRSPSTLPAVSQRAHSQLPLPPTHSAQRYDDEEEFDSLTDALKPKHVLLVASAGAEQLQSLRAFLAPVHLNSAFSGRASQAWAAQLWAGRDAAPFFVRVRARGGLDDAAASPAAAAAVWEELLQQNWRVELDYGLGADVPNSEALLLVAEPGAVRQLLAAACGSGAAPADGALGSVSLLRVGPADAGATGGWAALQKEVCWASRLPGPAETLPSLER